MGGSSSPQVQAPSNAAQIAQIGMQSQFNKDLLQNQQQAQTDALKARSQMLLAASQIAPEVANPDVWGQSGAYNIAKNTAELNALNQQALQKVVDPQGYQIAQNTKNTIAQLTDPEALKALSNQQFAQHTLPGMYKSGMSTGSQAFGSELFKRGTLDNAQLMQQMAGLGSSYGAANPAPQTGLSPGMAASIPLQANAAAANQGNAFLQGILGQGGGLQQGVEQGANSLYNMAGQGYGSLFSNIGQDVQSSMANQLAAQQANQNAQASQTGALFQGLGQLGGGIAGGVLGGPIGAGIGSAGSKYLTSLFGQ